MHFRILSSSLLFLQERLQKFFCLFYLILHKAVKLKKPQSNQETLSVFFFLATFL